MKTKFCILFITTIITLCISTNEARAQINYSLKASKQESTIKRKINGVNYTLKSEIEYKTDGSSDSKDFQFENKISIRGMGNPINKVIKTSDFKGKIDLNKIETFDIKDINFSVNESKDEIYLKYLLILDDREETVILTLKKNGEKWNLI